MAVVRIEIKTRQLLADGGAFGDVGCYQQFDGTAHFAVDPGDPANRAITDIDMAERKGDGYLHPRRNKVRGGIQTAGEVLQRFGIPCVGYRVGFQQFPDGILS